MFEDAVELGVRLLKEVFTVDIVKRWFTWWMDLLYVIISTTPQGIRLYITSLMVFAIRFHVDTFWTWVEWNIWQNWSGAYAQDERPVMEGVKDVKWRSYGPHPKELVHVVVPDEEHAKKTANFPPTKSKHIVYFHGGGFVFASSSVLFHSITCFARAGLTVLSFDYPLAPEDRFPAAIVSALRALHWTKTNQSVGVVSLFGDSAGANIVMMAAAMVCNRNLLEEFADSLENKEEGIAIRSFDFPKIECVASLYGLLDNLSWRGRRLKQITILENYIAEGGIAGALELYQPYEKTVFGNKMLFGDLIDDIHVFPRTLFVGGSQDPLVYSSVMTHEKLRDKGIDAHCKIYPSRHGFFGFPPQWTFGAWVHGAKPTCELLIHFFAEASSRHRRSCSNTATGVRCCVEENGDYGIHAMRAYDRHYSSTEDESGK
eukprot:m.58550 g.58550  ORF g.58550 m.58550 type:complete len:430 (+) comp11269_c0_seq1:42-1331(+)